MLMPQAAFGESSVLAPIVALAGVMPHSSRANEAS